MRLVLLCLLILTAAACRQTETPATSDLNITLEITPDDVIGDAVAIVTVTNREGQPVDGATMALRGDMTHAGMQPVLRETSVSQNGRYEVPYTWTMGGDWFVEVTVTLPDGSQATQTFDYTISS